MDVDLRTAHKIRDAANAAASGANGMTLMASLCLMAAHMAVAHCGRVASAQDQWLNDLVTATKLQLLSEGNRTLSLMKDEPS